MEDKKKKKKKKMGSINLPDELVMYILVFLPIKSLIRLRCVNKSWLQLITNDSHFAQLYLNQLNKKSNKIYLSFLAFRREKLQNRTFVYSAVDLATSDEAVLLKLPFHDGGRITSYFYGAICNGLVLVHLAKKRLLLWNPLTNDYTHIPYPPTPPKIRCSGFGFGQGSDDQYKVIAFFTSNHVLFDTKTHVSVYTLGTDSTWRNLQDISYHAVFTYSNTSFVNGALHWIAFSTDLERKIRILSFNMNKEVFRVIPHHNGSNLNYRESLDDKVGELRGLLYLLRVDFGDNIGIWVMQQYGVANSWIKMFSIVRPKVSGHFCPRRLTIVTQNGDLLLSTEPGGLMLYDLKTNIVKILPGLEPFVSYAYLYAPSLISPRAITSGGHII